MPKKLKPRPMERKPAGGFGVLAFVKPDAEGVLRDAHGHPVNVRGDSMVLGDEEEWPETEYEVVCVKS